MCDDNYQNMGWETVHDVISTSNFTNKTNLPVLLFFPYCFCALYFCLLATLPMDSAEAGQKAAQLHCTSALKVLLVIHTWMQSTLIILEHLLYKHVTDLVIAAQVPHRRNVEFWVVTQSGWGWLIVVELQFLFFATLITVMIDGGK